MLATLLYNGIKKRIKRFFHNLESDFMNYITDVTYGQTMILAALKDKEPINNYNKSTTLAGFRVRSVDKGFTYYEPVEQFKINRSVIAAINNGSGSLS